MCAPRVPGTELLLAQVVDPPIESEGSTGEPAKTPPPAKRFPRAMLTISLGAGYWPSLGKLEPDPAVFDPNSIGRPVPWGISIDFALDVRAHHWKDWDLFLGGEFGFLLNENKKTFNPDPESSSLDARLLSSLLHLTPSVKLVRHYEKVRPFIGAGFGLYSLELSKKTETGALIEKKEDKSTVGGYVSLGLDIPLKSDGLGWIVRIEDKVHFVDFGQLGPFTPGTQNLTGPINVFQIGIALAM